MKPAHCAAKVFLDKVGNKIYINGTNYFSNVPQTAKDTVKFLPLNTRLEVGQRLLDEEELTESISIPYTDLRRKYGYTIYKIDIDDSLRWRKNQRDMLVILPKKRGTPGELSDSKYSKRDLTLELDLKHMKVRGIGLGFGTLKGRYGIGDITPWIDLGRERRQGDNLRDIHIYKNYNEVSELYYDIWAGKEIKDEPILIKELDVLITSDGKSIVCIPKDKDKVPKILVVGKTGKGKTFSSTSVVSRIPYKFGDEVGILNDSFGQFTELMLPQDNADFMYKLARVGEEPRPLPVINLFMSGPEVSIKYNEDSAGFRLVVDFNDFCARYSWWSFGIKDWDLGKAIKYMSSPEVFARITKSKTGDEIKDILYSSLENPDDLSAMIFKWKSCFESIFEQKFTSNLFNEPTTAPLWKAEIKYKDKVKTMTNHPFIVSMYAGLIPVINDAVIKNKPIMPRQVINILRRLMEWQDVAKHEGMLKRCWVMWDEMRDLLKNRDLLKAFEEFFTQARFRLVGCIGNVQEYSVLPNAIRGNTDYLLVFALQTEKERKEIGKDFECPNEMDSIGELKPFECVFVAKEKVVVYDMEGRRTEHPEGGVWRGWVLPPLCTTKKPSSGVAT